MTPVTATTAPVHSVADMLRALRGGGLPVPVIAQVCLSSRRIVYEWLDGGEPTPGECRRVAAVFRSLAPYLDASGALYRVWTRPVDGHTLDAALRADPLDERAIAGLLVALTPGLEWHAARRRSRQCPSGGDNPVLDEMPVASIER